MLVDYVGLFYVGELVFCVGELFDVIVVVCVGMVKIIVIDS